MPKHGDGSQGTGTCACASRTSRCPQPPLGADGSRVPAAGRRKRVSAAEQCSSPARFLPLCAGHGRGPGPAGHSQRVIFNPPAGPPAPCRARDPRTAPASTGAPEPRSNHCGASGLCSTARVLRCHWGTPIAVQGARGCGEEPALPRLACSAAPRRGGSFMSCSHPRFLPPFLGRC